MSNEFGLLANLLASEGKRGTVLKVCCKNRTGEATFVAAMRQTLAKHYGDQPIGIGGVFIIGAGKVRLLFNMPCCDMVLTSKISCC